MPGILRYLRDSALLVAVGWSCTVLQAPPATGGELKPFVRGSYAAILNAHADRPLVVGFWATTCAPCLAEFPVWRDLQAEHPDFVLVLVSTDKASAAPLVARTLAKFGMDGVEAWIFADPFAARLRFEVDNRWRGELPRNYLIAADGTVRAMTGVIEKDMFRDWLSGQ
jgi:thiol-disulfide isomerase/thioredoxin